MLPPDDPPLTTLLAQLRAGDREALPRLLPHVYHALHRLAERRLADHRLTLGPTSLVHEAFLKLSQGGTLAVTDRGHFLAIAATAMRQIIVDRARAHLADKRGGGALAVTLDPEAVQADARAADAVALDDALERLDTLDPRLRRVVECRFFGGLTEEETAEVVGVTARTVRSDWAKARAVLAIWLRD